MPPSIRTLLTTLAVLLGGPLAAGRAQASDPAAYAEVFDAHWECLDEAYPYFELYGVDWDAVRAEHRPRALAAPDDDRFAWELARLIATLPDPHVSFLPSMSTVAGRWSFPEVETREVERRRIVLDWAGHEPADVPVRYAGDPLAYPEIVAVQGVPPVGAAQILAAGPVGTELDVRVRWPDGTETEHLLQRPLESNLPPDPKHLGERWLVTGRVGDVGYLAVRTFDPERATLGPDGKMTTMLRAALAELEDCRALVLDFQGNGGGLVAASDPFLGNLVERRISYRWGNSGGKRRVIRPRSPRYRGEIVALVDSNSASGGEWAARILRDAGRAVVVGGRTAGAEAAVHTLEAPDGSTLKYSAWPMDERDREPFQEVGIEVDHFLPLTLASVRELGFEPAREAVRRARFAKALELLEAPEGGVDALMALARTDEAPEGE